MQRRYVTVVLAIVTSFVFMAMTVSATSAAPLVSRCPAGYKSYSSAPSNSSGWSNKTPCCKPVAPGSILNCTARVAVKSVGDNKR